MPDDRPSSADLPSPHEMRDLLDRHPVRGVTRAMTWLPLAILAGVMIVSLSSSHPLLQLLPWAVLAGMIIFMSARVQRLRSLERQVQRVQELAMLRRYREAFDLGWGLMPRLTLSLDLYARNTALTSHLLELLKAYETAIVGYEYLIDRLPSEHPASVQLRVQRAIAQLESDHLADADDTLRRLRSLEQEPATTPVHAAYRFALLLQCVRTHHYDDAIAMSDSLLDRLRPLGVDAGYGHALLAWSYAAHADRLRQRAAASVPPREPDAAAAAAFEEHQSQLHGASTEWWSRATLLLPVAALTHRHAPLHAFSQRPAIAAATRASSPARLA